MAVSNDDIKAYYSALKNVITSNLIPFKKKFDVFPIGEINKLTRGHSYKKNATLIINGISIDETFAIKDINKKYKKLKSMTKPSYFNPFLRAFLKDAKKSEDLVDLKRAFKCNKNEILAEFKQMEVDLNFCVLGLKELNKNLKEANKIKTESTEEDYEIFEEGVVFNDKDVYHNKDKWDSGEINICFITGLSGSGKSTLAKGINAEVYELDDLVTQWKFTDDNLKEYGDMIYSFFKTSGKEWRKNEEEIEKEWAGTEDKYERDLVTAFCDYAIKYAASHKTKKFIIEGVWLFYFLNPEKFKDYAVFIKGTSALNSHIRAAKREIANDEASGEKLSVTDKIKQFRPRFLKNRIKWLPLLNKWIKYFNSIDKEKKPMKGFIKMGENITVESYLESLEAELFTESVVDDGGHSGGQNVITESVDDGSHSGGQNIVLESDDENSSHSGGAKNIPDAILFREMFEFMEDIDEYLTEEEEVLEGANIDSTKLLVKAYKETAILLKDYVKYRKKGDWKKAKNAIGNVKNNLKKIKKDLDKIDSSVGSAAIGMLIRGSVIALKVYAIAFGGSALVIGGGKLYSKGVGKVADAMVKTGKDIRDIIKFGNAAAKGGRALGFAGGLAIKYGQFYTSVKESIEQLSQMGNDIIKKKEVDATTFNTYMNNIKKSVEKMIKFSDSLSKHIDELEKKEKELAKKTVKESVNEDYEKSRLMLYESCQNGDITIEQREVLLDNLSKKYKVEEAVSTVEATESIEELNDKFNLVKKVLYERCSNGEFDEETREELISMARERIFPVVETVLPNTGNNTNGSDLGELKKTVGELAKSSKDNADAKKMVSDVEKSISNVK